MFIRLCRYSQPRPRQYNSRLALLRPVPFGEPEERFAETAFEVPELPVSAQQPTAPVCPTPRSPPVILALRSPSSRSTGTTTTSPPQPVTSQSDWPALPPPISSPSTSPPARISTRTAKPSTRYPGSEYEVGTCSARSKLFRQVICVLAMLGTDC